MCIGLPMQLTEVADGMACAERRGVRQRLDVMLLPDARPGMWVLAFQGSAVKVLSEQEARDTEAALQALEAAMAGDADIDRWFPDLAGREPQLPEHLRKP